jgi:cyclophilin family peptidyl-prolyl cis-trans isomerase
MNKVLKLAGIIFVVMSAMLSNHSVCATEWILETNYGVIKIELYEKEAPKTTAHIKTLTMEGFYNKTRFHRSIPGYVLQGGGYSKYLARKQISQTVASEAGNGLKNSQYTVAMARAHDKDSASTQFFINLNDNGNLDHRNETNTGYGYTVFGKVISGIDVLDNIEFIDTEDNENFSDFPVNIILIERAYIRPPAKTD